MAAMIWHCRPRPRGPMLARMSTQPVSSIKNLGPAFEAECARAGIPSADALRALGPDQAYAQLLAHGTRPHFIGYYVLVMALQGRPWNDCQGAEKTALRARFDALKAAAGGKGRAGQTEGAKEKGHAALDAALDAIGVRKRRP